MPQSVYVESPDPNMWRLWPNADGSLNVGNFPAVQPVSGSVNVTNFPSTPIPAPGDVVSASRDTTGVMYTVPAGRMFNGSASISACVAVAGVSQPTITTPASTIHKITINGLALTSVASANTIGDIYIWGGASGVAVTFTAGAAGTSTGQIAGRLL